ncbi:MAG: hypothetical protein IPO81_02455 [Kouleothrix sp.]|nr:hypothetical protein [Kouleothrix sp.]
MSRSYDPNSRHRRSIRLRGHGYGQAGAYFVTICTRVRGTVFGRVVRGVMHLNDIGPIAAEAWTWLEDQYPYVILYYEHIIRDAADRDRVRAYIAANPAR